MTHRRTVWDRQTDGLQCAAGIINALVFAAVIWGAMGLLLWWAFR